MKTVPFALATALAVPLALAHDWPSPASLPAWPGMLWAGPQAGPPPDPIANSCSRAPRPFNVDGPDGPAQGRASHPAVDAMVGGLPGALTRREGAMEKRADAASPAIAAVPAPPPRSPQALRDDVPVAAGMVDDNADFGEYLDYRRRAGPFPRRELAVEHRIRLDVRDAAGRPVPDAKVSVRADGQPVPLWARTDAGGQAWLMPQGDTSAATFEVQVSKGSQTGTAQWQRGQRDALQVRLDGTRWTAPRLDLVFVIDATGSMADEIDRLRRTMKQVADQIARAPGRPDLCLALVAYRDRGDEFFVRGVDFTDNLDAFQSELDRLRAGGGGDYAEAANEALHTAVHRLAWRGEGTARLLVHLADAPPHLDYGAPYYDHDLRAALARGIKIAAVGASGLDAQGAYVMRQAAQFTGGRFVFLTYADPRDPGRGPGRETSHDVRNYSVETLDKLIVRLANEELARWPERPS